MNSYYEDQRISQSELKRWINPNPRSLYRKATSDLFYEQDKKHFIFGSLLDDMITGEDLDNYYVTLDNARLSDTRESIAQYIYSANNEDPETILKAYEEHDYLSNYKEETKLKNYNEKIKPRVDLLIKTRNKIIVSQEDYNLAVQMSVAINSGEFTSPILSELPMSTQVALYTEEEKGLIDILQIDHDKKVARIIDIKTTGDYLEKFPKSIRKFRYDIQLSFYCYLLKQNYPDYTILDPVLIAVSVKEPDWAEPFTLTKNVIKLAETGFDYQDYHYYGWRELLNKIKEYGGELYNKDLIEQKTNLIDAIV
jgi:hypothetical protein